MIAQTKHRQLEPHAAHKGRKKKPEREKTGLTETTSAASESEKTSKENSSNGKDKKGYTAPTADSTIVIEYLNFEGDLKQFIGDPKSIREKVITFPYGWHLPLSAFH